MLGPLFFALVASAGLSIWSARRNRARLLARLKAEWGRPNNRARDMDAISDLARSHDMASALLDPRTWDDLLMDDVFGVIDRTESRIGQQVLYRRLRATQRSQLQLTSFDALIARVVENNDRRERLQLALARLHDQSAYYVHRLACPDALERRQWHIVFPVWTAIVVLILGSAAISTNALLVLILTSLVNLAIRGVTGRRVGREILWFRQLGPLLSTANALTLLGTEDTAALTGTLRADLSALKSLGAIARWVSRDPSTTPELVFIVLEYVNVLLLMDVNGLYFASRELQARAPHLLRVIETVGEIDAAIAVASFRAGLPEWTRPSFLRADRQATLTDLRHPLVDNAVANSITVAPPHGMLTTGSNMSGKSTFLRTVGVNVILAQTINTCLARSYAAPAYQVRSCIGRSDDLMSGKSYYLVGVESVLALVRASEQREPHLFIFDELFRGTNAVERIAAAEAVLRALIENDKPHVVLAATHDVELVDLLSDAYVVCHLSDAVGPEGLVFDYHLVPGPATSRDAIALLQLNGAPDSLVNKAMARASALDLQRRRAAAESPG